MRNLLVNTINYYYGYVILKTSNGGIIWDTVYQDNNSYDFNGIDFLDTQNGVVVGGKYDGVAHSSIVLFTHNGGDTWQPRYLGDYLADVEILDINKIVAVGSREIPSFLGVIYIQLMLEILGHLIIQIIHYLVACIFLIK